MTTIKNKEQYDWTVARVEELMPLVVDDTPTNDPASMELELLSNLVADYSDENFAIRVRNLCKMHTFHKMLVLTFCVHDFGVLMARKLVWHIAVQNSLPCTRSGCFEVSAVQKRLIDIDIRKLLSVFSAYYTK